MFTAAGQQIRITRLTHVYDHVTFPALAARGPATVWRCETRTGTRETIVRHMLEAALQDLLMAIDAYHGI